MVHEHNGILKSYFCDMWRYLVPYSTHLNPGKQSETEKKSDLLPNWTELTGWPWNKIWLLEVTTVNILTTHSAVFTRSTWLFVTDLVTGCRITYFRFGHVSGTPSTTITSGSKVYSVTDFKHEKKCDTGSEGVKGHLRLEEAFRRYPTASGVISVRHCRHPITGLVTAGSISGWRLDCVSGAPGTWISVFEISSHTDLKW